MLTKTTTAIPNYTILSDDEIALIYKNAYLNFRNKAEAFFEENKSELSPIINKDILINEMHKAFILCSRYNIDPNSYLVKIMSASSLSEIKNQLNKIKKSVQEIEDEFSILEDFGTPQRKLYGVEFPKIFKDRAQIYLKTSPIFSETELMQDIVNYLNHPLLKHEKFSFSSSDISTDKNEKEGKRFWLIQNQPMKPVKKLLDLEKECEKLLDILQNDNLYLSDFLRFISKIPNNEKLPLYFNRFKKKKSFPPFRLDTVILRHLIAYKPKDKESLIGAIKIIFSKLKTFREDLHEMLIKPLQTGENNSGIDLIILSTTPNDISHMSTFADWESCMSNEGVYHQDIIMQIASGSIIAYGVNSNQPEKKLARVLLKPYETPKTVRQRDFYSQEADIEFSIPNIEINNLLLNDYKDMYFERDEIIQSETAHLDETDFQLNPDQVERIYKIDKVYGLQHPLFIKILEEFVQTHLNIKNVYGLFVIAKPMYLDNLKTTYQIYDKTDKDNLVKFLTTNKIKYTYDSNNIIHTSTVNIQNFPEINLRGLEADRLFITGNHLNKINHPIRVRKLSICNPDEFNEKTFPSEITVSEEIFFCTEKRDFDMPFQIKIPEVNASHSRLINIAPDLQTSVLDVSYTPIKSLPPLKLSVLLASNCTQLRVIPEQLFVKNKLDISLSNIESLPALNTEYIIAKGAKNLKRLDKNIKFKYLYAQNTGLESIPENLTAESLLAGNTNICSIPSGTKIKNVNLYNTPLKEIHPNIQINTLDISKTPISHLPEGLVFDNLNLSCCDNLIDLPQDIEVRRCLTLNNTDVKRLPPIKTQVVYLVNCQNIEELPTGFKTSVLWASFSGLKTIPADINAETISCMNGELRTIPDNLTIGKIFDAKKTRLEHIGNNVKIPFLDISQTPIREIPASLQSDEISATYCPNLSIISPNLTVKKLNLSACPNIKKLTHLNTELLTIDMCYNLTELDSTVTFKYLSAKGSGISKLPDCITAEIIKLSYCPLEKLPKKLMASCVKADHTTISEIPQTIEVKQLNLDFTNVRLIPPHLKVEQLSLINCPIMTIHYSEHFKEIILNNTVKCIHPDIPTKNIKGISVSDILKAKAEYKKTFKNVKLSYNTNIHTHE